jgi:hypothetical protein
MRIDSVESAVLIGQQWLFSYRTSSRILQSIMHSAR